jgi:hypothetical protein
MQLISVPTRFTVPWANRFYTPGPRPPGVHPSTHAPHSNVIYLPDRYERRRPITMQVCEWGSCPTHNWPGEPPMLQVKFGLLPDRYRNAGFEMVEVPGCIWYELDDPLENEWAHWMIAYRLAKHEGRTNSMDYAYKNLRRVEARIREVRRTA